VIASEEVFVAAGTTDTRSFREIIWPRFVAASGTTAELNYRQDVSTPRLLADVVKLPVGERPSVVFVSDPAEFANAGMTETIDKPAANGYPEGWLDPQLRWWPLYVQPVVCVHNEFRGEPPRSWTDLGHPRFQERLVFEEPARMVTTGPSLAELAGVMDNESWEGLVASLAAQRPLIVGDNERSVLEVATGSRWVGLSNWNVSLRLRKGSPVQRIFLDPTPCIPGFGVLVPGCGAPELGRRFLAWLATEAGQEAYSATGRVPALLDLDVPTALRHVLPTGVSPLHGAVDWVARPRPWADRFRAVFGAAGSEIRDLKTAMM
jgi:ABC-type Fe3+ transport system substrate-binding protein